MESDFNKAKENLTKLIKNYCERGIIEIGHNTLEGVIEVMNGDFIPDFESDLGPVGNVIGAAFIKGRADELAKGIENITNNSIEINHEIFGTFSTLVGEPGLIQGKYMTYLSLNDRLIVVHYDVLEDSGEIRLGAVYFGRDL